MNETCGFKTAVPQLEQLEVEQSVKAFSNVQAVDWNSSFWLSTSDGWAGAEVQCTDVASTDKKTPIKMVKVNNHVRIAIISIKLSIYSNAAKRSP